jgi:glycosyltransferase involved in cell wall biosynthesis
LRTLDNYIYKQYHKVICISDGVFESLSKWLYPFNLKKLVTIYNGIHIDKFKNAKPLLRNEISKLLNPNDIILMMIGRFEEPKDQITVIKAISHLPKNYKLIFVGTGKNEKRCKDFVNTLGLESEVIFLGYRIDIPSLIKSSDIVIVSSLWEGFGLVAVEAIASGKIVIGTNVIGLRDIIGNSNLLFNVGDFVMLAQIVLSLNLSHYKINHYPLIKYDIHNTLNQYLALYTNIMNR